MTECGGFVKVCVYSGLSSRFVFAEVAQRLCCCVFRYVDKIKLVVLSAPLSRVHWQHVVQLGWFCHFPIVQDAEQTSDVQNGEFYH